MTGPRVRIVARIGLPRSPHGNFVLASLVAHALFVALLLLVPGLRPKPKFEDAYVVQLAAPAASEPAASPAPPAPRPKPPPPKPSPSATGVRVETAKPKKAEPDRPKPEPEPETPEEPPAAEPSSSSPDFEPEPASNVAAGTPAPGDAGASIAAPEGWDHELAWYRTSVTAALYSNWQRPILSGNLETLEVTLDFEILRSGEVVKLRVTVGSGVPSLDRSALRAVADASPLPPLPALWREDTLPARFIFQMHPEDY